MGKTTTVGQSAHLGDKTIERCEEVITTEVGESLRDMWLGKDGGALGVGGKVLFLGPSDCYMSDYLIITHQSVHFCGGGSLGVCALFCNKKGFF